MSYFLPLFVCFTLVLTISLSQDIVGFPEDTALDKLPKDDREALYTPSQCPEGQILYPGDQKTDRVCDCRPGYIYFPSEDDCFPIYERGPCALGQYLALPEVGYIPECIKNPCRNRTLVPLHTKAGCVALGSPCDLDTRKLYGVNITTLNVECLHVPEKSEVSSTTPKTGNPSLSDSKKNINKETNVRS